MITNFAAKSRYRTGVGVPLVIRGPSGGGVHGSALPLPEPRGVLRAHAGPQDRPARDRSTTPRASSRPRSATTTRCSSSSTSSSTAGSRKSCRPGITWFRSARRAVRRPGRDLSIITYGAMVWTALEAAKTARSRGHRRRGRGPAHALSDGRADGPRIRREDQQGHPPPRGHAHRRHRRRRSPPSCRSAPSSTSTARSSASPRPTRRCPTRRRSRSFSFPTRRKFAGRRGPWSPTDADRRETADETPPGRAVVTLDAGTRLGAYQVLSRLGAGGMGEVYRARDTRLGRDVAIKILPRPLSQDPERLARFEREARLLASLNHPQHRRHLRPRERRRRVSLPRPGARRGRHARPADRGGAPAPRRGAADLPPDHRRARGGARAGASSTAT